MFCSDVHLHLKFQKAEVEHQMSSLITDNKLLLCFTNNIYDQQYSMRKNSECYCKRPVYPAVQELDLDLDL